MSMFSALLFYPRSLLYLSRNSACGQGLSFTPISFVSAALSSEPACALFPRASTLAVAENVFFPALMDYKGSLAESLVRRRHAYTPPSPRRFPGGL